MKVEDVNHIVSDNRSYPPAKAISGGDGQGLAFARQLNTLSEAQYQQYIADLQERIKKQGEKIKEKADLKAVMDYRALIGELLGEAAGNAFACHKTEAFDAHGRHKVHFVIRSVNQKLEELAKEVLSDEQDNLRILKMVDDIRGLLVDLFM